MKTKSYFLNQARARIGKPPMISRNTPQQTLYFRRNILIPYFRDQSKELHGTTYFDHPIEFKSAEKANSAIGKLLKDFFSRCDEDIEKAKSVIDWFLSDTEYFRAVENNYSPTVCFSIKTVSDFENKDVSQKKKPKKQRVISFAKRGGDES